MSLRDQLIAKGLVSKKKARKVDRQSKAERKAAQGARQKKKQRQREALAAQEAERLAAESQRREAARSRQAAREAVERPLRIRNLLLGNRLTLGRGQRFWHRSPSGRTLGELQLSSGLARQLRSGDAALAWLEHRSHGQVVAIPKRTAQAVAELDPSVLLFFVEDPTGLGATDLGFHERTWEPDLAARRATDADLARLRQ